MLEKMDNFFTARVDGYDEHMKSNIEGADVFYGYTASLLPKPEGANVLDLGCGTGLELEEFFEMNPGAKVTGIDLTKSMLDALKAKFPGKDITLICGSYFDEPFGEDKYDAAVSVESLHHFTKEEKIPLYTRLCKALTSKGYFILTDCFSKSDEEEASLRQELFKIRKELNLPDGEFYHFDTPLTVEHEKEALLAAGFSSVDVLKNWDKTYTLKASK
ncbi:class I SAM-dependent methyltransferase [Butyrivibrio sp. XB500-5]|uniref:class I SAM-dependent methyltransferase n=1 Tax=Butyrivibrio sp. XB500-5 TaxID=2364880 RepID=UPI000EAA4DB5|nr:class I SAM-dependent methyltransferase [Butyrivibrio sp. XB500-5]RKM60813.1 class I SAM-dependent methyltransferase [Butyrivibrio sp. XB500-5]